MFQAFEAWNMSQVAGLSCKTEVNYLWAKSSVPAYWQTKSRLLMKYVL